MPRQATPSPVGRETGYPLRSPKEVGERCELCERILDLVDIVGFTEADIASLISRSPGEVRCLLGGRDDLYPSDELAGILWRLQQAANGQP